MKGRFIGEIEWMIGEKYWEKGDKACQKRALDVHYRKAFHYLSGIKDYEGWLEMAKRLKDYEKSNLALPKL